MFFFFKSLQVLQPVLTQLTQLDIVQEKRKLLCLDTYNVVLLFEGLRRKIAMCTAYRSVMILLSLVAIIISFHIALGFFYNPIILLEQPQLFS